MEEKIDILLATYNGEKYLKEQIDSILNQTYKNIRIIISDDCSTDKTREILQEYEKKDERISVYYQKQNLGCVKNFDFLLQKVENKLYMLSDQDDIWLPEKIEKSVKTLEKENADLVFCDLEIVDEELKTINSSFCKSMKLDKKIKKCISSYKMQYLYNCITGCTILSKKEYIKDILPIPTKSKHIIHDHWIGLVVLLKNGKVAFLDESCIKYRQHRENQVGVKKKSYGYDKIEDVRNLFIEVKEGIFETYIENNEKFPEKLQKLNKQALKYFKSLRNKKYINFRNWNIFHKLYCNESFTIIYKIL